VTRKVSHTGNSFLSVACDNGVAVASIPVRVCCVMRAIRYADSESLAKAFVPGSARDVHPLLCRSATTRICVHDLRTKSESE
jgi:hypothetical protein